MRCASLTDRQREFYDTVYSVTAAGGRRPWITDLCEMGLGITPSAAYAMLRRVERNVGGSLPLAHGRGGKTHGTIWRDTPHITDREKVFLQEYASAREQNIRPTEAHIAEAMGVSRQRAHQLRLRLQRKSVELPDMVQGREVTVRLRLTGQEIKEVKHRAKRLGVSMPICIEAAVRRFLEVPDELR